MAMVLLLGMLVGAWPGLLREWLVTTETAEVENVAVIAWLLALSPPRDDEDEDQAD
jgi:hypothetical protein